MQLDSDLSQQLREQTIAVSLSFKKFGITRAVDERAKQSAADSLDADAERLTISEKIIDKNFPEYKAIASHLSSLKKLFEKKTIDTQVKTVRLMNTNMINEWQLIVQECQTKLDDLVFALNSKRDTIIDDARQRLGDAFNEEHFPDTFIGSFAIDVAYPSIGPDERLKTLNPALYEEQERRVKAVFDNAIAETTAALTEELSKVITSLVTKLTERKQVRSDVLEPLHSFLDTFENVRLGASNQLKDLVAQAKSIIDGANGDVIRRSASVRNSVAEAFAPLSQTLNSLVESQPERMILL